MNGTPEGAVGHPWGRQKRKARMLITPEDLWGRKKTKRKLDPYDKHIHYQGTWSSSAARQRYIDAVRERLDAIATWRGVEER